MGFDAFWSGSFRILFMLKRNIILFPSVVKNTSLGAVDGLYHLRAVRPYTPATADIPNEASTALETFMPLLRQVHNWRCLASFIAYIQKLEKSLAIMKNKPVTHIITGAV